MRALTSAAPDRFHFLIASPRNRGILATDVIFEHLHGHI
jgi:hypothetical protein